MPPPPFHKKRRRTENKNNRDIKSINFHTCKFCNTEHFDDFIQFFIELTFNFHQFNIFSGLGDFMCISYVYTQVCLLSSVYSREFYNRYPYLSPVRLFWGVFKTVTIETLVSYNQSIEY